MAINNVNNGLPKAPVDNNKVNSQQQVKSNQTAAQQAAASAAQASTAPRQDSVSLTQSAQQLNQVQKKSADVPVNQEKVDKLKKAIQSGEYKVDPQSLAKKIARLESEIFGMKS
ncbi:flagellar biosynthesis anti-sigma factor FlgM [Alteromonas gilva]|uniref:Negative regulator of flagellin synthesis n=1 Tax=Alteromonas gilva TaxID=2987522 RepID=A0ABT5L0L8_9ALTE|nr:flagellar biosynthesis anti-sigma factor FlgM [Alteromonas gilva]MDC8830432.1 flagellar biosynthesis anti-sigma factor FlgM [Alteromonas gilva]